MHDSVSWYVFAKRSRPLGTEITNRASIVFDFSDPFDTPMVRNTLVDKCRLAAPGNAGLPFKLHFRTSARR